MELIFTIFGNFREIKSSRIFTKIIVKSSQKFPKKIKKQY